ncbi:diphthamide biosynthesis protein 3 [Phyllosticta citribraziliensis]
MADETFYDEIEIEDMTFDPAMQIYHYPCPCGDRFEISLADLRDGEDVGVCPSCSLMIKVIFDQVGFTYTPKSRENGEVERRWAQERDQCA